jgi:hypothetical protein
MATEHRAESAPDPPPSNDPDTDDLGYRDDEEERAYERAQPNDQPEVSSDPEPETEPADAG